MQTCAQTSSTLTDLANKGKSSACKLSQLSVVDSPPSCSGRMCLTSDLLKSSAFGFFKSSSRLPNHPPVCILCCLHSPGTLRIPSRLQTVERLQIRPDVHVSGPWEEAAVAGGEAAPQQSRNFVLRPGLQGQLGRIFGTSVQACLFCSLLHLVLLHS